MVSTIKQTILAASIALISFNAHATLTSYNANGVDLVYSSVSDVTWTKDANLIYSMIVDQGFDNLVNNIIAANQTSTYTLSAADFEFNAISRYGQISWFGAIAFGNYLNSISYGGSNDWRLPTVANTNGGWNSTTNGVVAGDEMSELFYQELNGVAFQTLPDTTTFDNEQFDVYWSGTESSANSNEAWFFFTSDGNQQTLSKTNYRMYAWFVSPGQITTVPEPENLAMLLAGLGLLGVAVHRKKRA
ncbi:DUF1566 domain-containing protein [Methylophilus sp. 14]|uniref:Lcl C-terminal domain-containing protein n=1 Tax=Methylophilus sp. 14 TaxID=2781019 RepID=UPI0018902C2B|nr:DUF1566 domain-containing protein [Methylophilus sp. 14]MBF4987357.1 DUF1566 domain-containing protein [Methylophilus sp. 14]